MIKKHFAIAALLFVSASAYSQVGLQPGVIIGVGSYGDAPTSYFIAGGVLDIPLSRHFSIEPRIEYQHIGSYNFHNEDGTVTSFTSNQNYIAASVNGKLKFPIPPIVSPYILIGLNYFWPAANVPNVYSAAFDLDIGAGVEFNAGPIIPFIEVNTFYGYGVNAGIRFKI